MKLRKKTNKKLKAFSLTEILIVLAIIGILLMMVLPNQNNVAVRAHSIKAQTYLNQLYALQKSHNFRFGKYTNSLEELGFEKIPTILEGGTGIYEVTITEASVNSFKAIAKSVKDFDDDGNYNTWEIDQRKILKETVRD